MSYPPNSVIFSSLEIRFTEAVVIPRNRAPTPPCIPTSVPSRLSWHGPNLLLSLPRVKFDASFYFSLPQRPHKIPKVNYSVVELWGNKIQNLFPCCHSCRQPAGRQGSRACPALDAGNPWFLNTGSLHSQGQRLDSRFRGSDSDLGFFSNLLSYFAFGDPVFMRPAELSGIQQGFL